MPLLHSSKQGEMFMGIWDIQEDINFFLDAMDLYPEESIQLQKMNERRQLEWLASRHLLHVISGRKARGRCIQDEYGKPHMLDSSLEISMSHSRTRAAVIASPYHVGVDIQKQDEKIQRLYAKFVRPDEIKLISDSTDQLSQMHLIWGCKEAMYKAWGKRGIDFRADMWIEKILWKGKEHGIMKAYLQKRNIKMIFDVRFFIQDDYYLVYATEEIRIIA